MLQRTISGIGIFLISSFLLEIIGQSNCITSVGAIYGSPNKNERAKCVLPTLANDGVYAIGMMEDSVLIVRLTLTGQILWARTFDIVPGKMDNVTTSILDAEGMIVTMGIAGSYADGGTIFAFRYNPNTNQVLWSKEYVNSTMRSYAFAIVQKPNGNYILALNPHPPLPGSTNDDELLEVNKTTGAPVAGMDKVYDLGGSDAMAELVYYQNFLYAAGRYTDGQPNNRMRNTIIKIDPATFDQVWVKVGHVPVDASARMYGKDLIVEQDGIFSLSSGDPSGTSTTNTKLYVQKLDLDGNVIWMKQYELPGSNDLAHQIIKSGSGFIVLATENGTNSHIDFFKIDSVGNLLWSKQIQLSGILDQIIDRGNAQIVEIGNSIFITGTAVYANGSTDIIILKTDLNGMSDLQCGGTTSLAVSSQNVINPTFYAVTPSPSDGSNQQVNRATLPVSTSFPPLCVTTDTVFTSIDAVICSRQQYEGYTQTGIYVDTFASVFGCDSIRELQLNVTDPMVMLDISICNGDTYLGHNQSGIYEDTLHGMLNECDTLRHLTLNVLPNIESMVSKSICTGQSFEGYSVSGNYVDTLQTVNGCDSVRILDLLVSDFIFASIHEEICFGHSFEGYSDPGIYTDTFQTKSGCDSIRELHLTRLDAVSNTMTASICDQVFPQYNHPGIFLDTFVSYRGCDSIQRTIIEDAGLYIPNAFSPNDDGINDVFTVFPYPDVELGIEYFAIFDRFGDMVYETTSWPIVWRGTDHDGKKFQPAVFAYVLKYHCNNKTEMKHGDITLIK